MRKTFALVVAALSIGVPLASPAVAEPARTRIYEGTTAAGHTITIISTVRNGVVRFRAAGLEGTATCDDGTTVTFAHGFDLAPGGIPLAEGTFEVEHVGFSDAFSVAGRLGPRFGSGTLAHRYAALDALEEPQLCSTGELTWTVRRVRSSPGRAPGTIVVERAGGVTETARLTSVPSAIVVEPPDRFRLRSYEGRTSAGNPLFYVTSRWPGGVVLLELGISWDLACDDGGVFGLGFLVLFSGEPLGPGRVDYDVTAPEVAFHVNGLLDPHGGDGSTTAVLPALTPDLEATACRSGDLSWRAWRIDPGA